MRPRLPTATCRLQFNSRFTFRDALGLVDYLFDLGISDIYASPLLAARPGSLHGYDVIDPSRINPELGTIEDFEELGRLLGRRGMGLILDVVPNHMCAIDPGNRWWGDVLEKGIQSPYARYFDIDFHPAKIDLADKILLPILGDQYGRVLENQEIRVDYEDGEFLARYQDQRLPLVLNSWKTILEPTLDRLKTRSGNDDADVRTLDLIVRTLDLSEGYEDRKKSVVACLKSLFGNGNGASEVLSETLRELNGRRGDPRSFDTLESLLARQAYRISSWRVAADEINYRRFFDINELVAIRIEEPEVFAAVHELTARFIRSGAVSGLRIDHLDGLSDPVRYLTNLRTLARESGAPPGFLILVEKILQPGERLDPTWPVDGTTGYDFLNTLTGLLVEPKGLEELTSGYEAWTRRFERAPEVITRSKRLVLQTSMAGELHVLALRLDRISEHHRWSRDFTLMSLERALAEVIAAFPVYRTYIERGTPLREFDRNAVATAIQGARHSNPATNESIFSFIESVLLEAAPEGATEGDVAERMDFIRRFQQLTGPVMAKGLEDTASYRRYPLASFCEVGGNPDLPALLPREFHAANAERATLWPRSLSASATHDTKRGEDVRARLAVLSELPDLWFLKLGDWRSMNEVRRERLGGRPVPDANEEYLLYQTMVGTLPRGSAEAVVPELYVRRIDRYMEKALREAKVHTSWISPNLTYEAAVRKFVRAVLDPAHSFLQDLRQFVEIVAGPGFSNSLAQVILKITSPGIPDFYQGTEFMDFHLADPDNREPVDYARRRATLDSIRFFVTPEEVKRMVESGDEDRLKMFVMRQALHCRRLHARLFEEGAYRAIEPEGSGKDHVVAFCRALEGEEVVIAVSHLPARPGGDRTPRLPAPASWDGTRLTLPEGPSARYRDLLTGALLESRGTGEGFDVGTLFRILPVALLERVRAVELAPGTPSTRT